MNRKQGKDSRKPAENTVTHKSYSEEGVSKGEMKTGRRRGDMSARRVES